MPDEDDDFCRVSVRLGNADSAYYEPVEVESALIDTGSLMSIIPERHLESLGLAKLDKLEEYPVYLANGQRHTARKVRNLRISFDDNSVITPALVMGDHVLLGINFLKAFDLVAYPRERVVCPLGHFLRAFKGRDAP